MNYRAHAILPIGTVNLKTGECQYFNIYEEWGEDEGIGEIWKNESGNLRMIFTYGGSEYSGGERKEFKHDQQGYSMGTWAFIKSVPLKELKEKANEVMKTGKITGYVYK